MLNDPACGINDTGIRGQNQLSCFEGAGCHGLGEGERENLQSIQCSAVWQSVWLAWESSSVVVEGLGVRVRVRVRVRIRAEASMLEN